MGHLGSQAEEGVLSHRADAQGAPVLAGAGPWGCLTGRAVPGTGSAVHTGLAMDGKHVEEDSLRSPRRRQA